MSEASSLDDDSWISKSNWHRPDGTGSSDQDKLSLRYLDEFVGDLTCSAQMLAWGLFPDAKEVSETMGVFNAVRKLGLHEKDTAPPGVHDGIVIVGDGVTPRTAAMFAYRTKGWTCYSVDPIMKVSTSDAQVPWDGGALANVVSVCDKIENIRIRLRKAIVVLVHAHVTIEQAMVAIDATEVVAVLTLPCCNWYGRQERYLDRHPDIVYDDLSILSVHREIRVWVGTPSKALIPSLAALGRCVFKSYSAPVANPTSVARAFLSLVLQQSVDLSTSTTEYVAAYCVEHFHPSSRVGVIGRHDGLVSALTSRGFTAIHSIESDYVEQGSLSTVFNVVLDCGSLHLALNRTEKTKSGNLVGSLCQLWQSWLDEDIHPTGQSGAVVVVSSRRMLRSSKFLNRPALNWASVVTTPVCSSPTFIYHCKRNLKGDSADGGDATISPSMDQVYAALSSQFNATSGDPAVCSATGKVTRVQTLHVNLSFVDLEAEDGATTFVLLRRGSLPQDQAFSMPRALMQHLQLGDVLQVTGTPEPTKNGSSVVVASAVRVVQWVSRDTLVYFNYN
ncbi:hypothetical protein H257_02074 [Aphanomyces astaci]|uniref:Uncharacterized protein n=1 Tax=Aphanomyces astaci TaxID=112090 RepID=W4H7J2_APHAT|nr:hypothetical protein H257_02074 [Aphanomyces astaci]ETV87068.1 hypothetical protein H257_02074 [Aphanomyces astaci]|eukprot:XP_009823867.1 hypothetical protein H257_02074 [Aphanomyces astaci]